MGREVKLTVLQTSNTIRFKVQKYSFFHDIKLLMIDWRVHGYSEILLVQYICYYAIIISTTNSSASTLAVFFYSSTTLHFLPALQCRCINKLQLFYAVANNGQPQYNCLKCLSLQKQLQMSKQWKFMNKLEDCGANENEKLHDIKSLNCQITYKHRSNEKCNRCKTKKSSRCVWNMVLQLSLVYLCVYIECNHWFRTL